ncbi:MAG TPA: TIGR03435 family protein [Vicinamibacterales bacterium]|nr:TIGR03435 family protein [Vicinamibacterales bacterium]
MNNVRSTCAFALVTVLTPTLTATTAFAQNPAAAPAAAFDVASVRPSNPNPDPNNPLSMIALMLPQPGGRFTATNTPLQMLIMVAFELQQEAQLVGGPPTLMAAKYDITARVANTATIAMKELPQLLRTLLADRFKLTTHTETRELPVYDLVLARSDGRLGPDMKPSKSECANDEIVAQQGAALAKGDVANFVGKPGPCMVTTDTSGGPLNLVMRGDGQEMKQLVEQLSALTGRTVRDKTGLTGRYDFAMKLDLQMVLALAKKMGAPVPAAAANIPQADGSSLMTALNEQLGLKLESTRGPVNVVIIDSVEAAVAD